MSEEVRAALAKQWQQFWSEFDSSPRETLRTFLMLDSVCSCCGSDEGMYELVARTVSRDRTVDYHQMVNICTRCDFGEDG